MEKIEELAVAALRGDSLVLRSLYQDMVNKRVQLSEYPKPKTDDPILLAAAASLMELLAQRCKQFPPTWTEQIGPLKEPIYLVASATTMTRLRDLCKTQSPEPLRKRGFYAPPNFLEFA